MEEKRFPVFAERFATLRVGKTQGEFADFLGISRPTIGFYENGSRLPDALLLRQIAERCNVSTDWLLGLSDAKSPNSDIQTVVQSTGLSEPAVKYLCTLNAISKVPPEKGTYSRIQLLSDLMEQKKFDLLLALTVQYTGFMDEKTVLSYSMTDEFAMMKEELEKRGYKIVVSDEKAQSLFNERIVSLLRTLLDGIADNRSSEDK